ncbi:MAG: hypothetical protein ACXAEN_22750 [Candidatus Thorarchaeota archaeon]|jgi:hypothetical protein
MKDRFELSIADYQVSHRWTFGQPAIDNKDQRYIRDMLARIPEEAAHWLVNFCKLVIDAVDS